MFDYGTKEFRTYEDAGVDEAIHCAFVLVAGERTQRKKITSQKKQSSEKLPKI